MAAKASGSSSCKLPIQVLEASSPPPPSSSLPSNAGSMDLTKAALAPSKRTSSVLHNCWSQASKALPPMWRARRTSICSRAREARVSPRYLMRGPAVDALMMKVRAATPPTWNMSREPICLDIPGSKSTTMAKAKLTAPRSPLQIITVASCQLIGAPRLLRGNQKIKNMAMRTVMTSTYKNSNQRKSTGWMKLPLESTISAKITPARKKITVLPMNSIVSHTTCIVSRATKRGHAR
mmetsp:Transcript_128468/g.333073  ORF Transcript_128468/g.333073 Transcript_128468/m.333073 type:complete len:236 (+) Transcript_128468:411-1118(+)